MADRDGDNCRLVAVGRRRECAEKSERLEVDPGERQPGKTARLHVALDEVAMRDDEQNAPQALAAVNLPLAEHAVVEHRLVEWDRQRLLSAETDGVEKLALVVDRRDLDAPHADAAAGDAETHTFLRQVVAVEERAQCICESFRVTELAAADDAARERNTRDPLELGAAVVRDAGRGDLRAADLQADDALDLPVPQRRLRRRRQRELRHGEARERRQARAPALRLRRALGALRLRRALGALRLRLAPQADVLLQEGPVAHEEATRRPVLPLVLFVLPMAGAAIGAPLAPTTTPARSRIPRSCSTRVVRASASS